MEVKKVRVFSRADFRKWLEKHHSKESKVALVIHKKHTGKKFPTHRELLEEAICFGWVDTTVKGIDEDTFLRHFSKRGANSKWSDNTLRYARELLAVGRMTPAGIVAYESGLKRPTHDFGIPKNPSIPLDLKRALSRDKLALENFTGYSRSVKRMFYRWVLRAKRAETRSKRVVEVVRLARAGRRVI